MTSYEKGDLRVIGAGLPRTATTSLREALAILGFTPCHTFIDDVGKEFFPYRNAKRWQKALAMQEKGNKHERQKLLRQVYTEGDYHAAVDYPSALFLEDLVEMYPNAKFVHTIRSSPDAWAKSVNSTIGQPIRKWEAFCCYLIPSIRIALAPVHTAMGKETLRKFGVSIYANNDSVVELYRQHNDWVKQVVPKRQLLADFAPSMGWQPLCEFLGVPIPTDENGDMRPFPHVNDSGQMNRMFMVVKIFGLLHWAAAVGVLYGVVAFAFLPGLSKAVTWSKEWL